MMNCVCRSDGETRYACIILVGKSLGKCLLGILRRWEYKMRMDLREISD
jgi:hypothetical protein